MLHMGVASPDGCPLSGDKRTTGLDRMGGAPPVSVSGAIAASLLAGGAENRSGASLSGAFAVLLVREARCTEGFGDEDEEGDRGDSSPSFTCPSKETVASLGCTVTSGSLFDLKGHRRCAGGHALLK